MTTDAIAAIFNKLLASVFQPLMEAHYGERLMEAMARKDGRLAIPCNVLIAPDGKVAAREIGMEKDPTAKEDGRLSWWGSVAGQEFGAAMATGFFS